MKNNKKLVIALAAMLLVSGVSTSAYAVKTYDNWETSTNTEIDNAVNKVIIYKDAILVFTNSGYKNVSLYDDTDHFIASKATDKMGNAILNVEGYHDALYKDHYLEIDGVRVYLNDDKVMNVKSYFYDENKDDNYDPDEPDETDELLITKFNIMDDGNALYGEIKDHPNEVFTVYLNDKPLVKAMTNENEKFYVKLPRKIRNLQMFSFYKKYDLMNEGKTELNVWGKVNTAFSVSGFYNPGVRLYAVYGDKYLGETVVNSDGTFTIKTMYRLPSNATVKFYNK